MFLRERYGIPIDQLPRGDGFATTSIEDRRALRDNVRAFTGRLREVGFYRDLSDKVTTNDELARLLTFPNVLVTSHMAFLTDHALRNIAETTLGNFAEFERTGQCANAVSE